MPANEYPVGARVTLISGEWREHTGVVSWPISPDMAGYVLVESDGRIAGFRAAYQDVVPASDGAQGFTQLTYQLIKLSSLLIERAVLPIVR